MVVGSPWYRTTSSKAFAECSPAATAPQRPCSSHLPRVPSHRGMFANLLLLFFSLSSLSLWWITTYLLICQRRVTDTETGHTFPGRVPALCWSRSPRCTVP